MNYEKVRREIYFSIMTFDYDAFEKAFKEYLVNYAKPLNVRELDINFFLNVRKTNARIQIVKLFLSEFASRHSELMKDIKINI